MKTAAYMIHCPYFHDESVGLCTALRLLHIPSIAKMERYCFRDRHTSCARYRRSGTRQPLGRTVAA